MRGTPGGGTYLIGFVATSENWNGKEGSLRSSDLFSCAIGTRPSLVRRVGSSIATTFAKKLPHLRRWLGYWRELDGRTNLLATDAIAIRGGTLYQGQNDRVVIGLRSMVRKLWLFGVPSVCYGASSWIFWRNSETWWMYLGSAVIVVLGIGLGIYAAQKLRPKKISIVPVWIFTFMMVAAVGLAWSHNWNVHKLLSICVLLTFAGSMPAQSLGSRYSVENS